MDEYFWIIGGGLLQVPLIFQVKQLGYKVIISDKNIKCICHDDADIFLGIDIFNVQEHIDESLKLKSSGIQIKAVLAAGIDATVTMAVLCKVLDLPGVDPSIAYITNNKDLFRAIMKKNGYPTPKYFIIDEKNIKDIDLFIQKIGFPLIVKNTDSSGSRGTRIFYEDNRTEILNQVKLAIECSRSAKALMEEVWMGQEQTVETIFDINGKFHPCFITDRHFDKSKGYTIETGLRHPTCLPEETQKEMYDLVKNIATDIGIKIGAAKADVILTADGPRIIEMTVRLSGGFDSQYLVPCATGKNVLKAAILTSLGKDFPPSLLVDQKRRIGLTFSIWPEPGEIISIEGLEKVQTIPGFENIFFRYKVGDIVEEYIDCTKRVCYVVVSGKNEEEAAVCKKNILQTIKITTKKE